MRVRKSSHDKGAFGFGLDGAKGYVLRTFPSHADRRSPTAALMRAYLDFEKPVAELEAKGEELKTLAANGGSVPIGEELTKLEAKAARALADIYKKLTPW